MAEPPVNGVLQLGRHAGRAVAGTVHLVLDLRQRMDVLRMHTCQNSVANAVKTPYTSYRPRLIISIMYASKLADRDWRTEGTRTSPHTGLCRHRCRLMRRNCVLWDMKPLKRRHVHFASLTLVTSFMNLAMALGGASGSRVPVEIHSGVL